MPTSIPTSSAGFDEWAKFGGRTIGMGTDDRAGERRHVDALEIEMGERAGKDSDAIGRAEVFIHEHDEAPADSAQASASLAPRARAESVPLEALVADLEAEPSCGILEQCGQPIGVYA